ncbi:hypothetical protein KFK09_027230 [Dendrobium nobile]|uniref:Nuclear transcription factor Y subunit n=1 Tax=Dendrobium nobile TaxID=94219 RepID=A0A8T3AA85_DENNO|nr:hypothetical protein KFK09_027230 [Dendrobium nobile]
MLFGFDSELVSVPKCYVLFLIVPVALLNVEGLLFLTSVWSNQCGIRSYLEIIVASIKDSVIHTVPSENWKGSPMQNMCDKDSQHELVQSAYNYPSNGIPWWNSCGPHILLYPTTTNLYASMNTPASNQIKQVENQMLEQESSSTQSSGSSHGELSKESDDSPNEWCLSGQSGSIQDKMNDKGDEHAHEKFKEGQTKPVFLEGKAQVFFKPTKFDSSQSLSYVPYAYADTQYTGGLAAYGSHAVVHPQMIGMPPPRFALPVQPSGEEPIYVNAKQYHAILRRREHRAKLESQSKTVKTRKPYLHESRHQHAMKRARGIGGRFLNTKKLQEQQSQLSSKTAEVQHFASSEGRHAGRTMGLSTSTSAAPTCLKITSVSNSGGPRGIFQSQHHFGFSSSDRESQFQRNIHEGYDGLFNNGPKPAVPVNR